MAQPGAGPPAAPAAAVPLAPRPLHPGAAPTGEITVTPLRRGSVFLIQGAGTNVVAVQGPEGAFLINGGMPELAEAVVEAAKKATKSDKIAAVFNTGWREQYTGANDLLGAQGVPIISQENTKLWMRNEFVVRWENLKKYEPRTVQARPTETFRDKKSLALGRETAEFGWLQQASTDGDAYVFLKDANVLVTGGTVANGAWPLVDYATGGWGGGMLWGMDTLINTANANTIIVPSVGPVMNRVQLRDHQQTYLTIFSRVRNLMEGGAALTIPSLLERNVAREFVAERGDPSLYLEQVFESFWGHIRQFNFA